VQVENNFRESIDGNTFLQEPIPFRQTQRPVPEPFPEKLDAGIQNS